MTKQIEHAILNASGRALATNGPAGLNVIPVSAAQVIDGAIHLFDFFMSKTVTNIQSDNHVALVCWEGLSGVQVKATAEYVTNGVAFEGADKWAKEAHPDRKLRGVLVLSPNQCYSVTPSDDSTVQLNITNTPYNKTS